MAEDSKKRIYIHLRGKFNAHVGSKMVQVLK